MRSPLIKKLFIIRPSLAQGGADRNTIILLELLDRSMFDVSLVLMRGEGEFLSDVPADVKLHVLGARSLWTAWWPLVRLLRAHQPDVMLSTSSGTNMAAALAHILGRQKGRLVLSERTTLWHGERTLKRRVAVLLKRVLYPVADKVTVISAGLKHDVIDNLHLSDEQLMVVYNPVVDENLKRLCHEPLSHPWFSEDIPIVLAVGRLVHQKDYPTLLRAFKIVREHRPARLMILGEGPLRDQLLQLANELGVFNDVTFHGFDKNPFKYMSRCSVFVLSSAHEGLGSALIQAMACGAAVVATDCPHGPSEIIAEPGKDGFLVPVGDVAALAERIVFLLDHPEQRLDMSECARRSAERFNAPSVVQAYTAAILGTG